MKPRKQDALPDPRLETASTWCLKLAEGQLSPTEEAEFAAWLTADPNNSEALDRVVHTWQRVGLAGPSPELIERRAQALAAYRRANRIRWTRPVTARWRSICGAAAVLLIALVSLIWWSSPDSYKTDRGERRVFVLPDGSQIAMDASTHVKVRLSDDRRDLWLIKGRARFDVAKDPLRPFTVHAGDKIVVATGTSFSVEMLQSQMQVVLYEGRVSVHDDAPLSPIQGNSILAAPENPELAELLPGQKLVAAPDVAAPKVMPVDLAQARSWENGQLNFTDEPLTLAIERMNRYATSTLSVDGLQAGQLRVNGVYNAGDVEAFVVGVTETLPVRVERRPGMIVFKPAGRP